jgi:hypothetical protein|tara:strand:- start:7204 stop:8451 length:1248 start_codon:yes stop_codon:yes gene_type:complete
MANTSVFETKLSKRMQVTRYSTPVYVAQASFEERANLFDGQSVVRPTFATLYADSYTRGTDMTEQGYTEASETLTVNQTPAILLRADKWDALQHKSALQQRLANDGMRAINKLIDADYNAEVLNATSTIDDGDFGGTDGDPLTLDATNVLQIYAMAQRKLQLQDVDIVGAKDPRPQAGNMKPGGSSGFANLNPYMQEQLTYSLAGRESVDGNLVGQNAYKNSYFEFDNFVTTNGQWTGVLGMATQPTNNDTVVINGVTFTFVSSIGSTPGNLLIQASVDLDRELLQDIINAPDTATSSNNVQLSTASQNALRRMTATNDDTNDILTVQAQGYGYVVVSETFTDATDAWDSETSHQMFGQKGAIDMVMQANVGVDVSDIPAQLGKYIKPHALYGINTFTEGANALVDVALDSSDWA